MNPELRSLILQTTGASELLDGGTLQSLWSGYGSIDRYGLVGAQLDSIVVKHVRLPDEGRHPRGWNTDLSHQRKLHSYQVETHWYAHWASRCGEDCRIPRCLAVERLDEEVVMIMEDLDASGYPLRKSSISVTDMHPCLGWLSSFHARFMGEQPEGLWKTGTYWHLATRPDELASMQEGELKQAAGLLDQTLSEAPYQAIVHGDAKLANFCFSKDATGVAAVDFQYVGGGCGMKDVAYFIGSCLDEHECEIHAEALLDTYFSLLKQALEKYQPQIDPCSVEQAWRPLYAVAWTDFHRFVKGWSPGHWKIHSYSERLAHQVVSRLQGQRDAQ